MAITRSKSKVKRPATVSAACQARINLAVRRALHGAAPPAYHSLGSHGIPMAPPLPVLRKYQAVTDKLKANHLRPGVQRDLRSAARLRSTALHPRLASRHIAAVHRAPIARLAPPMIMGHVSSAGIPIAPPIPSLRKFQDVTNAIQASHLGPVVQRDLRSMAKLHAPRPLLAAASHAAVPMVIENLPLAGGRRKKRAAPKKRKAAPKKRKAAPKKKRIVRK